MSATLTAAPADCTCVWTVAVGQEGGFGAVFIAGQPCPAAPHPRRFDSRPKARLCSSCAAPLDALGNCTGCCDPADRADS